MTDYPLITWMVFLPLLGGLFLMFVRDGDEVGRQRVRLAALIFSLITFLISAAIYYGFKADFAGMQFIERALSSRGARRSPAVSSSRSERRTLASKVPATGFFAFAARITINEAWRNGT